MKKFFRALAYGILCSAVPALADTVVTNATPNGWAFDFRDGGGTVLTTGPTLLTDYVVGPSAPPLGTGSAHLSTPPGGGDGSGELRNSNYAGTALSTITALSYSTFMSVNNGQQFPYLVLTISTTGGTTQDDKIYFEPPYQQPSTGNPSLPDQGATSMNLWQTWNALEGGWWNDLGDFTQGTGVGSFADYLALYPNATIVNAGTLGGVRFNVGFASPGDAFDGNVDNFTIGINSADTTFDFEASAPAPLPNVASMGMVMLLAVGIGGYIHTRRARKIA
jgi:hypothetical protein